MKFCYLPGKEKVKQLTKKYDMDAGYDIASNMETVIPGKSSVMITTGIAVDIPVGYYGKIASRSGLKAKHNVDAFHGTIDYGYRGEVCVILNNNSKTPFKVSKGDRIAQLVVLPCLIERVEEVAYLEDTDRGVGGFGSTGIN